MSWEFVPSLHPIFLVLIGPLIILILGYGLIRILFLKKSLTQAFTRPQISIEDKNARDLSNSERITGLLASLSLSALISTVLTYIFFFSPLAMAQCDSLACIAVVFIAPAFWAILTIIMWLPIYFLFKKHIYKGR